MDFYDKYYNQKELWGKEIDPQEKLAKQKFIDMIPDDVVTILDVGCGDGSLTNLLVETGKYDIIGCDISKEALKYVKTKTVVGRIEELLFPDVSFDLVVCSDVLEHLSNDVLFKGLTELQRVSKKYIMVMGPQAEDLSLSKTKCFNCSTVYHINYHIHSFKKEDYYNLFSDFSPVYFSYTGGKWPVVNDKLLRIKQEVGGSWAKWDKAICPLCGEKQVNRELNLKEHLISDTCDKLNSLYIDPLKVISPLEREIIILFEKKPAEGQDTINDGFAVIVKTASKQPLNKSLAKLNIKQRSRYQIFAGEELYTQKITDNLKEYAYLLVNERMDWGNKYRLDKFMVRDYKDNAGLDCHAIFICPPMLLNNCVKSVEISYKDVSEEPVYVEVYDQSRMTYIRLGVLEHLANQRWKKTSFNIPANIQASPEGMIFHLITDNPHPQDSHPINKICFYLETDCIPDNIENEFSETTNNISIINLDKVKQDFRVMFVIEVNPTAKLANDIILMIQYENENYFLGKIQADIKPTNVNFILPVWCQANEGSYHPFIEEKEKCNRQLTQSLALVQDGKMRLERELFVLKEEKNSLNQKLIAVEEELDEALTGNLHFKNKLTEFEQKIKKYSGIIKELEEKLMQRNFKIEEMAKELEIVRKFKIKYEELVDLPTVKGMLRFIKERKHRKK